MLLPLNNSVDPWARVVALNLSLPTPASGNYLCAFLPAEAPAHGIAYLNVSDLSLGSRLWTSLPPNYAAYMAPVIDPPDTYVLLLTDSVRSVRQRCRLTAAFRGQAAADAPPPEVFQQLHDGHFGLFFTRDEATAFGAKAYCHILHGGGIADQR